MVFVFLFIWGGIWIVIEYGIEEYRKFKLMLFKFYEVRGVFN